MAERRDEGIFVDRVGERAAVAQDRVRWGPIWAGLLTALSLFLLLELLAYALGWLTLGTGEGAFPTAAGRRDAWITGIIGLISFFLGGMLTGATAWVRGAGAGLINGFCLWALGTVLILILSALGLGAFFGAAGNVFNQLLIWGRGINFGALGVNPDQFGASIRDGALWAFILMALSAAAAMLGGWVGSSGGAIGRVRRTDRIER
ncbi:MAG: permease [Blastocatellales bacterium]